MRKTNPLLFLLSVLLLSLAWTACEKEETPSPTPPSSTNWKRSAQNPIYRDIIPDANYQAASDGHIFYDEAGTLHMIYSGDIDGNSSIKLARGNSPTDWEFDRPLVFEWGPSQLDRNKETAFYRQTSEGKHQIYYIGYNDETIYDAQIFLAEADQLQGPYTQSAQPIVARGDIAGKSVYCITSPSIVEHEGLLYLMFLGWNAGPSEVTEVWVLGATSTDEGHTWSDFQVIETPIGMEGQVTKRGPGDFVAVCTRDYQDREAIFYATASHPYGPWVSDDTPILNKAGEGLEKDELIAPQITFNPASGAEYLFYTGVDHQIGWWMMLAEKE